MRLAAATCNLALGGSTTFLLNFQRALAPETGRLGIVAFGENRDLAADFAAAGAEVRAGAPEELIYEDRLAWAYRALAERQPAAVLACLGAESFEMLRLAPPGVARIGVIQSDDPRPTSMARRYAAALDAMVGVSPRDLRETARAAGVCADSAWRRSRTASISAPKLAGRRAQPGSRCASSISARVMEEQKRISRVVEVVRALEGNAAGFPRDHRRLGSGGRVGPGGAGRLAHRALRSARSPIRACRSCCGSMTFTCCSPISKGCR